LFNDHRDLPARIMVPKLSLKLILSLKYATRMNPVSIQDSTISAEFNFARGQIVRCDVMTHSLQIKISDSVPDSFLRTLGQAYSTFVNWYKDLHFHEFISFNLSQSSE